MSRLGPVLALPLGSYDVASRALVIGALAALCLMLPLLTVRYLRTRP